ncbi:hypothetical protein [Calothrix sp. UHCC 0171]|nr:hypothetical protein [Calothrix sp. UHCC 0171]MEA5573072.1 hypothetical protein [Calothrix sp. UHCC 0171]
MKSETLAELVARTVIEFEKREAQLQQASQVQQQQKSQAKCHQSQVA